jgi:prepilin-type N-terminal cleavage/methylation domain-containing protein
LIKIFYAKNQKGFSLIEMMVVVVILGLIVLGLVTFFTGGAKSWVAGQSQLEAQRNARQAIDRMVREIREGKNVKINSTSNSILFITPFDGSPEIRYHLNTGGTLYRNTTNAIIDNVLNLSFTYFDNNGDQICDESGIPINPLVDSADASKVSKVHVVLEVDVDNDENPDITLNTDINLRNYGLQ